MVRLVVVPSTAVSEEDHSASSTFDVTSLTAKHCSSVAADASSSSCASCAASPPPPRVQVHFDEDRNVFYESSYKCKQELHSLWYSRLEMDGFQEAMNQATKDIERVEQEHRQAANTTLPSDNINNKNDDRAYTAVLARVYQACCKRRELQKQRQLHLGKDDVVVFDDNENAHDNDAICAVIPQRDMLFLHKWFSVAGSRLGLERFVVRSIRRDKWIRRRELLLAVLECQQEADDCGGGGDWTGPDLAAVAQEISSPSRLFARILAQAAVASSSF